MPCRSCGRRRSGDRRGRSPWFRMAASKVPSSTVPASVDWRQDARQARRMSPPRRPARRCRGHGRRWHQRCHRPPAARRHRKAQPKTPKPTRLQVRSPRRPIPRRRPPTRMTMSEIQNESAPETGALPRIKLNLRSLDFDHLRLAIADWDLAGLLRLGNLTHEIDVQETVLKGRALDVDVVGKLEDALERAGRDALIEHLAAVLLVLRLFLAFDRQRVFLRLDRKLVLAEAGHRHRDTIGVLAGALDVVGRIARSGLEAVEHGEEPVETDGRTIEGSKIESSHGITSWLSEMRVVRPAGRTGLLAQPQGACANPMWGSRRGATRGQ